MTPFLNYICRSEDNCLTNGIIAKNLFEGDLENLRAKVKDGLGGLCRAKEAISKVNLEELLREMNCFLRKNGQKMVEIQRETEKSEKTAREGSRRTQMAETKQMLRMIGEKMDEESEAKRVIGRALIRANSASDLMELTVELWEIIGEQDNEILGQCEGPEPEQGQGRGRRRKRKNGNFKHLPWGDISLILLALFVAYYGRELMLAGAQHFMDFLEWPYTMYFMAAIMYFCARESKSVRKVFKLKKF